MQATANEVANILASSGYSQAVHEDASIKIAELIKDTQDQDYK